MFTKGDKFIFPINKFIIIYFRKFRINIIISARFVRYNNYIIL